MKTKDERFNKGLELFSEAASSMFYSSEELIEYLNAEDVAEFEILRESVSAGTSGICIVGYSEQNEGCDMAAEDLPEYK